MSEQVASSREDFQTALRNQQERVVAAVAADETIEATPIIRDDETLSCEEYVTLVYELHHVYLPELQAAGVIEFDRREDVVSRGEGFDEPHLRLKYCRDR
ncbi:hypothetical protein ACFQGT_14225 [Natrialbaceae archaeon GCM10025810]|uniref:hypothetical protein n=1 Tax=Halovalidus salilacus TaxID=3075124 RepID=UPI0036193FA3